MVREPSLSRYLNPSNVRAEITVVYDLYNTATTETKIAKNPRDKQIRDIQIALSQIFSQTTGNYINLAVRQVDVTDPKTIKYPFERRDRFLRD